MSEDARTGHALATTAALLVPIGLGLLVGWLADSSALASLILYVEPLLISFAVYLSAVLLLRGDWAPAVGLLVGVVTGALAARLPARPVAPATVGPEWADDLKECSRSPQPVTASIRLVTWTLDSGKAIDVPASTLAAALPDIVVLTGLPSSELGDQIAELLDGEARFVAGAAGEGGTSIAVRGDFLPCGSDEDVWATALRTNDEVAGTLVAAFPRIEGVGLVPLLAVWIPGPGGPSTWSSWPERVDTAGRGISAVAGALQGDRTVLVGDFGAPRTFRHLAGQLLGAGLREGSTPPTWPAHVGPLPGLPLHPLDRMWYGDAWGLGGARTLPGDDQPRAPLLVELVPKVMRAG